MSLRLLNASVALVAVMAIGGCSGNGGVPRQRPTPGTGSQGSETPSPPVRPQRLFREAGALTGNLPRGLERLRPAEYRSVLDEPLDGPAVMAAVQIDTDAEATGFADQLVTFISASGERRSLNPVELGLEQSEWVAADGSGLGALSPDGDVWTLVTRRRVVLFELQTSIVKFRSLPNSEQPTSPQWSAPHKLLVGSNERAGISYLLSGPSFKAKRVNVPRFRAAALEDGSILEFGRATNGPVIRKFSQSENDMAQFVVPFSWDNPLPGPVLGRRVAVFFDSEVESGTQVESRIEVLTLDAQLSQTATLKWPSRRAADDIIGWVDDQRLLVRQDERLCVWEFLQASLKCANGFSSDVALSVATSVVNANA